MGFSLFVTRIILNLSNKIIPEFEKVYNLNLAALTWQIRNLTYSKKQHVPFVKDVKLE